MPIIKTVVINLQPALGREHEPKFRLTWLPPTPTMSQQQMDQSAREIAVMLRSHVPGGICDQVRMYLDPNHSTPGI